MNNQELINYCLRIADNSWLLGNRLADYMSKGPFLEEDLAITNVGLDHVGLAEALYNYCASMSDKTGDDYAFKRSEHEYFNCHLVEYPNKDYGYLITRQFFFDAFNLHFFELLKNSKDETLSALAKKSHKEIRYHFKRSSQWMVRLGDGTEESAKRIQECVHDLWMYTEELFVMDNLDKTCIDAGVGVNLETVRSQWNATIQEVFSEAKITKPDQPVFSLQYGKHGFHTDYMGYILTDMQYLTNRYPDAQW